MQLHQSSAADSSENSYLLVTKHLLKVGTHVAIISIDFPGRVSVSPGALANKSTDREKDMNTLAKSCLAAMTLLVAGMASADWSANLGWASEYHYRGVFQQRSSASGGVDFEQNGFYAGTWTADVATVSKSMAISVTTVKLVISTTVLALLVTTTPAILMTLTRKSISVAAMDWSHWMLRLANMRILQARRRTIPITP